MKVISPKRLLQSVFPTVRNGSIFNASSLDLQFARTKTLDSRITFTRASSGTYVDSQGVIRTATTNQARFDHNPITGESLGLLVEESRTNLVTQSQALTTSPWSDTAATTSPAPIIDIFGGTTAAFKLTEDNTNSAHLVGQNQTAVASTSYSVSVWFKAGSPSRQGRVLLTNTAVWSGAIAPRAVIDLSNAGVISSPGFANPKTTTYPNGWILFTGTVTSSAAGGTYSFRILVGNNAESYQGDGTSYIYVGPCQLEAGSFPTSYIPTTTAAVTRSADVASITGSNFSSWYRQDEGTVFAEGAVPSGTSSARALVGIDDGTNNERILSGHNGTTAIQNLIVDGGTTQVNTTVTANSFPVNTYRKLAFAFRQNDFAAIIAPGTVEIDTSGTMPTPTQLQIGNAPGRAQPCLPIKRITYWPQRLPNETLQQITQ